MSQMLHFEFESDPGTKGVEGETGNLGNYKSWKTLRVERSGWNLVGRISTCRRYVIDVTGLDPLSLGELGGGVQCFGEFGASERARIRPSSTISPIRPYGGLK